MFADETLSGSLPQFLASASMRKKEFIIAHEMCRVRRLDHATRILSFAALAVHWFNPMAWIAFVASGKDMEFSCDEAVMKNMRTDIRAEYSQALLRFGAKRGMIHATPQIYRFNTDENEVALDGKTWLFGQIRKVSAPFALPSENLEVVGIDTDYEGKDIYISSDGSTLYLDSL